MRAIDRIPNQDLTLSRQRRHPTGATHPRHQRRRPGCVPSRPTATTRQSPGRSRPAPTTTSPVVSAATAAPGAATVRKR